MTVVNTITGEVLDRADAVAPVAQIENLPAEIRERAVTAYLAQARDQLAEALEATGPQAVASIKAEVATVAEMTKQLGLSKECRDDATEMVRRAEYALGKAIRKGQEEGAIRSNENPGGGPRRDYERNGRIVRVGDRVPDPNTISPSEFFTSGSDTHMTYAVAEATDDQFEDALSEARTEGNLSRANVVRKVKSQQSGQSRQQRADLIADLARQGYSTRQMPPKVGIGEQAIRMIARDFNIDIPADRVIGRSRRVDSNRVLSGVAESLSGAAYSLQQVDPLDLDQEQAQEWVDSLTESLSAIRKALKPIKESLHD